jgi:autotransporter-associated beta strand protein
MRNYLFAVLAVFTASSAFAQTSVNFSIDTQQAVKPISRYIYGVNQSIENDYSNAAFTRLGGNRWTAYNWENNASNAGSDWNFQNDNYLGGGNTPGGAVASRIQNASDHNAGVLLTIPMAGYVSADKLGNGDVRYVNGGSTPDPNYLQTRFKQSLPAKGSAFSLTPNTSDASVYQDEFVNWVKTTYPYSQTDPNRPICFALDHEPDLWSSTHAEVHPNAATYAEMIQKSTAYATAIKNVMPNTLVFGPVSYGFNGYVNLQNAPDANGRDFLNFYLQQMKQAGQTAGKRLLDVLDVHWYPEAKGGGVRITQQNNTSAVAAARIQAPRSLWDTTYSETSWIKDYYGGPIYLLPRLQSKIDANYPGTKLAITEYNYGGGDHISGAIAEADVLGIFGRQGVFAANQWPLSDNEPFIGGAFRMFRNFNGNNGAFGDTSVFAQTNDNAKSSIYASLDSLNPNRMVLVAINKTDQSLGAQMNMQHAQGFVLADIYRLTSSSATPQYADSVLIADPASFNYTMPAYSVNTIEIRPGSGLKRNLVWNQAGGNWNTANAGNRPWVAEGHGAFFLAGDQATFGNAGLGNVVIDAAGVSPDTLRVQNTSGNYVFSGGSLSGSTILEKTGAGTLTLANNNSYTGGTSISGGILALDASGQISPQSAITNNATFRILAGNHTVGAINGTGKIEVLSGTLTVASIRQSTLLGSSNAAAIPEPAALLLLLSGTVCLIARRRFSRQMDY